MGGSEEQEGQESTKEEPGKVSLGELAVLFLRLDTTAFGGPAAHIAMMEDEVVRRRRWLSREKFLDLLGATSLIPGPNSTELAIHIGHLWRGWPGLIIAVVLQALWSLGRSAAKTKFLAAVGLVAHLLSFLRVNELLVLLGAGLLVGMTHWLISWRREGKSLLQSLIIPAPFVSLFQATVTAESAVG